MNSEALHIRRQVGDGGFLLEFASVPSTQDIARQAAVAGDRSVIGVRSKYQSEGRGRRGSRWCAPPGACLLITYILRPSRMPPPSHLSFAAGLAVAEAIESITGLSPTLKWPNDVLIGERKVAGILIETAANAALVGIGLNVNVARFPMELSSSATSLLLETGSNWSIHELEAAVRALLPNLLARPLKEIVKMWSRRDGAMGRRFAAVTDGVEQVGVAEGIDSSGALILKIADGRSVHVLSATSVP